MTRTTSPAPPVSDGPLPRRGWESEAANDAGVERRLSSTAVVPASLAFVRELLEHDPGVAMSGRHVPVGSRRFPVELRVGTKAGVTAVHRVDIEIGLPAAEDGRFPISWKPAGQAKLLPDFHGTIEVAGGGGPEQARVEVTGSYRPPAGRIGLVGDGLVGHRIARRSLDRLVTDLTDRLGAEARRHREDASVHRVSNPESPGDRRLPETWLG